MEKVKEACLAGDQPGAKRAYSDADCSYTQVEPLLIEFCKEGNLPAFQCACGLYENFENEMFIDSDEEDYFVVACSHGHRHIAEWLSLAFPGTYSCRRSLTFAKDFVALAIIGACRENHVNVVTWLLDTYCIVEKEAYEFIAAACVGGNLELVKQLDEKFRLPADLMRIKGCALFVYACRRGRFEVAKWLADRLAMETDDVRCSDGNAALRFACQEGHLDLAMWMVDKFKLTRADLRTYDNYAMESAKKNGHDEVVAWLTKMGSG